MAKVEVMAKVHVREDGDANWYQLGTGKAGGTGFERWLAVVQLTGELPLEQQRRIMQGFAEVMSKEIK